ncbi:acyl-CoA dehydrogenase family protein [Gordonia sp. VNK21]|uniref:acyl-CoA dehydrogenase family protein n=1 Tax=Gordonia sp. VNK21 TaxID=3382483 RepID=UPI0038D43CB5
MTIATSEVQRAAVEAVAGWARARQVRSLVRDEVDVPADAWRGLLGEIAELGVFLAGVPEEHGGAGGSFADTAVILGACGRELVPGPLPATAAAAAVLASQGSAVAADLLAGEQAAAVPAGAIAAGEPIAVVDGRADLGLVAGAAPGVLIVAPLRFGDAPARWYAIPAPSSGERLTGIDGTAAPSRIVLESLAADELTELGDGELFHAMLIGGLAAFQSGVAEQALTMAVDYAKVRTQFGAPIGSFQAIKHLCAEMLCRSEQLTAAAWDLASAIDDVLAEGDGPGRARAREQLELSRLATAALTARLSLENAKDAIQVLGGIGFTFEHDAHLYLRSALSARAQLGGGAAARAGLARLGRAGVRREFAVDLAAVEYRRPEIAALARQVADAADGERRAELARTGLLAPHWPEPYGLAADPALQLLIDAELDRVGVARPDLVIAGWALPTILEHGTAAQREQFVAPTLAGEITWCQLFSEPEAGSDLASLRTRAVRTDGGWLLTGQKIWTSEAHNAQWAVCLARTDPEAPKHKGITYFLVDMSSPGLDIRPLRELTGRAMFNEVFLDGVFVPDEYVVGEIDGGWRLARTTLANERVAMGGSGLGKEVDALLRQLDAAGAELTDQQIDGLGAIIADAHIGRVLDARALTQRLSGTDPGATSSVRKLIGVVHRQQVPEFALDLLGTGALTPSSAGELFLLNRCLSIAGGTTQILRTAAAERILGLPRA